MAGVCAEPRCPALVEQGYCPRHQPRRAGRDHFGIPRQQRGHGADYDRLRKALLGQPCHWCGRPATTADYAIPYSQGGTLADVVPACGRCNYGRGAQLTNARRRESMPSSRIGRRRTFRAMRRLVA